jgi:hypothetical protein
MASQGKTHQSLREGLFGLKKGNVSQSAAVSSADAASSEEASDTQRPVTVQGHQHTKTALPVLNPFIYFSFLRLPPSYHPTTSLFLPVPEN